MKGQTYIHYISYTGFWRRVGLPNQFMLMQAPSYYMMPALLMDDRIALSCSKQ